MSSPEASARVLILSMRNFEFRVGRTFLFEFEYAVADFEQVEVLAPNFSPHTLNKITRKLSRYTFNTIGKTLPISQTYNQLTLDKEYDLFLFICQYPSELYYLDSIKDWRKKCRKAVCWLDELWAKDVNKFKPQLTTLKDFDRIFMNLSSSIEAVATITQRPCSYMPPGIDAIKFCPYPLPPQRSIDVCSIGRRPPSIHASLLKLAEQNNFFYMYDTMRELFVRNYNEHRSLYRNLIKRSRYFIAYKPKFNLTSQTGGQEELNARFFEGAAGGAVMLGIPPRCEAFSQNFDWEDVVIALPEDTTNIEEVITDLDAQPERLAQIRINNVVNSLLRHDWVYRWEKILDAVDISPSLGMSYRKTRLQELAKIATESKFINE